MSDLNRQDILANRRLGELFAVPPDLVVQTHPDAVRALARARVRDPEAFEAGLNRIYADPSLTCDDELELDTEPPRILRRFTAPIRGRDGTPVGRLWTFLDVTETHRLQQEVQAQLAARTDEYTATSHVLRVMNALCPASIQNSEAENLLAAIATQVVTLSPVGRAALLLGTAQDKTASWPDRTRPRRRPVGYFYRFTRKSAPTGAGFSVASQRPVSPGTEFPALAAHGSVRGASSYPCVPKRSFLAFSFWGMEKT